MKPFLGLYLGTTLCITPLAHYLRLERGAQVVVPPYPILKDVFLGNPYVRITQAQELSPVVYSACGDGHVIQRLLRSQGLSIPTDFAPELFLSDEETAWAQNWLQNLSGDGRSACVFSTQMITQKEYYLDCNWSPLRTVLGRRYVVVEPIYSPFAGLTVARHSESDSCFTVAGLSLRQYMALISQSALFVGGLSGGAHVAAAFGTPALIVVWPTLYDQLRFPCSEAGPDGRLGESPLAWAYPHHHYVDYCLWSNPLTRPEEASEHLDGFLASLVRS